jgi:hypothetical protein
VFFFQRRSFFGNQLRSLRRLLESGPPCPLRYHSRSCMRCACMNGTRSRRRHPRCSSAAALSASRSLCLFLSRPLSHPLSLIPAAQQDTVRECCCCCCCCCCCGSLKPFETLHGHGHGQEEARAAYMNTITQGQRSPHTNGTHHADTSRVSCVL